MISKSYLLTIPGNGSLGASWFSTPVNFNFSLGFSCHVVATGTPTGTLKIQVSNDPNAPDDQWVDLSGATFALAGAAASTMFNVLSNYCGWYRLAYTRTSGTGALTARHLDKRIS